MIIIHTLQWVQFAGTEKVCVDLCNHMADAHEVYLFSNNAIRPYLSNKVNLIEVDFEKNRYNPFFLWEISKKIRSIKPDIVHCHNAKEIEVIYNSQFFQKSRIPIVASRHNPIKKKKFQLADLGVAVSDETMQYTNSQQNITILNGIPYKKPTKIFDSEVFSIVAVGRLAPVKGFDILIEALSVVNFDFRMNIIGEGESRHDLQQLIDEKQLHDKIKLVGFVDNVQDYIYSSDLQVISSKEEGLSLALIEGIFYANALIASDISNHKSLLGEKLIFDLTVTCLAEKLEDVFLHYGKFCEKFQKVKETKHKYSIENVTKKYLDAYATLLE